MDSGIAFLSEKPNLQRLGCYWNSNAGGLWTSTSKFCRTVKGVGKSRLSQFPLEFHQQVIQPTSTISGWFIDFISSSEGPKQWLVKGLPKIFTDYCETLCYIRSPGGQFEQLGTARASNACNKSRWRGAGTISRSLGGKAVTVVEGGSRCPILNSLRN